MLIIRQASVADEFRWNAYIEQHPDSMLGHQFVWFSTFQAIFHIQPYYWIAESDGNVVGVAPFFKRSHIGLGTRLTSMPYLNTGGILANSETVQHKIWSTIQLWAQTHNIKTIELRNRDTSLIDYEIREGRTVSVIDIPDTYDAALKLLKSSARRNVKKAQKANLKFLSGFQYLESFWQVYAENMQFLGAPVLPFEFFDILGQQTQSHLHVVENAGEVVAGMVLMDFKDGTENGWVASKISARDLAANDFLYWSVMEWCVDNQKKWFDLGRSEKDGGHQRFKEKFGAKSLDLPYQEIEYADNQWRAVSEEPTALYDMFRTVWRKLPPPLAKRVGGYFSRQIY